MTLRFRLVGVVFLLAFLSILARLFYWQIIKAKDLSFEAKKQYQIGEAVSASRGNILADDGSILAGRDEGWLIYAYIPDIKEAISNIADRLAPLLAEKKEGEDKLSQQDVLDEASKIKQLLSSKNLAWVPIKRKVETPLKNNVEAMGISGIGFDAEDLRIYPEASSAAHLLGFVGKDADGIDRGYFGLEGYYDLVLSGKPGYVSRDADAKGTPIMLEDLKQVSAVEGIDIITHVNKGVQIDVEKKLKEGIEKYGASAGTVVIMEPKTGAVISMASFPGYDPANYSQYSNELFRNPAISDGFEPGSIFKIVVMASALDAGLVKPDTRCDICDGPLKVDKYFIETWNNKYHPDSTMTDVIVNSDNVGMSFVGQKLGADKFYDYVRSFGFGEITGIDLEGEASPEIRKKGTWNVVDLATASFGQGIAVTPIQMARAVAVIANDGIMVKPRVAAGLRQGEWKKELSENVERRIIGKEAADEVSLMMAEAAKSGESKWTYLKGFKVAGKTGTAQIPIAGHYDANNTIASFVGFAPYDDPKFVMLVTLRKPQTSPWASETAAPLWYNIAKDLFVYYKIQPG
jgi:cell division protein FtsI/penicillin-binding protein 2